MERQARVRMGERLIHLMNRWVGIDKGRRKGEMSVGGSMVDVGGWNGRK
jgi:hypothetical protein